MDREYWWIKYLVEMTDTWKKLKGICDNKKKMRILVCLKIIKIITLHKSQTEYKFLYWLKLVLVLLEYDKLLKIYLKTYSFTGARY